MTYIAPLRDVELRLLAEASTSGGTLTFPWRPTTIQLRRLHGHRLIAPSIGGGYTLTLKGRARVAVWLARQLFKRAS